MLAAAFRKRQRVETANSQRDHHDDHHAQAGLDSNNSDEGVSSASQPSTRTTSTASAATGGTPDGNGSATDAGGVESTTQPVETTSTSTTGDESLSVSQLSTLAMSQCFPSIDTTHLQTFGLRRAAEKRGRLEITADNYADGGDLALFNRKFEPYLTGSKPPRSLRHKKAGSSRPRRHRAKQSIRLRDIPTDSSIQMRAPARGKRVYYPVAKKTTHIKKGQNLGRLKGSIRPLNEVQKLLEEEKASPSRVVAVQIADNPNYPGPHAIDGTSAVHWGWYLRDAEAFNVVPNVTMTPGGYIEAAMDIPAEVPLYIEWKDVLVSQGETGRGGSGREGVEQGDDKEVCDTEDENGEANKSVSTVATMAGSGIIATLTRTVGSTDRTCGTREARVAPPTDTDQAGSPVGGSTGFVGPVRTGGTSGATVTKAHTLDPNLSNQLSRQRFNSDSKRREQDAAAAFWEHMNRSTGTASETSPTTMTSNAVAPKPTLADLRRRVLSGFLHNSREARIFSSEIVPQFRDLALDKRRVTCWKLEIRPGTSPRFVIMAAVEARQAVRTNRCGGLKAFQSQYLNALEAQQDADGPATVPACHQAVHVPPLSSAMLHIVRWLTCRGVDEHMLVPLLQQCCGTGMLLPTNAIALQAVQRVAGKQLLTVAPNANVTQHPPLLEHLARAAFKLSALADLEHAIGGGGVTGWTSLGFQFVPFSWPLRTEDFLAHLKRKIQQQGLFPFWGVGRRP